jgi:hypothetical protein
MDTNMVKSTLKGIDLFDFWHKPTFLIGYGSLLDRLTFQTKP